jgi:hypothetical protein
MISGRQIASVLVGLSGVFGAIALQAAEPDLDQLMHRLVQPAPASLPFTELRFSQLLDVPIVVSGELEYQADGSLVRQVEKPYRERTVLHGENVIIERENQKPRRFSLNRAPELRGLIASFAALLANDRSTLDEYFSVAVTGSDERWQIALTPHDEKLRSRLAGILIDGTADRPRCYTLEQPNGNASIMALGARDLEQLALPATREAIETWCRGGNP